MQTITWQRLEGLTFFVLGMVMTYLFNGGFFGGRAFMSWYVLVILFFAFDLSFVGYLINNVVGAWVYNIVHSFILPIIGLALGLSEVVPFLSFETNAFFFLWIAHIGFDRMLGYGLKEVTGFKDTHLGRMG